MSPSDAPNGTPRRQLHNLLTSLVNPNKDTTSQYNDEKKCLIRGVWLFHQAKYADTVDHPLRRLLPERWRLWECPADEF